MAAKQLRASNSKFHARRNLIKYLGISSLLPLLPSCQLSNKILDPKESFPLSLTSPINRTLGDSAPEYFSGDDFTRPHQVLWNKRKFIESIGGLPKPKQKQQIVIIGGGMSGLMSAYLLSEKKPIVLEQASRFGGNAKGEVWRGMHYSIGAAYLIKPDQDSILYKVLTDLNIIKDWTIKKNGEDHVVLNGLPVKNFWQGVTDPKNSESYRRLKDYFISFLSDSGNIFPDYPTDDIELRRYINRLDQEDFYSHLLRINGSPIPPHLLTLLEHYCFSSFAGSVTEISAAAGINFFAAEFSDVAVFPGGNSYIAEALHHQLHQKLPPSHLLANCLVFDVRRDHNGLLVSYLDANNETQSILAEKIIMACPKFVAIKLIDNFPAEKSAAIQELEYRAYVVANLLINRLLNASDYDLYWLGNDQANIVDSASYAKKRGITDIINAGFSSPGDSLKSILSFYQAFPYSGGRTELYVKDAYPSIRKRMLKQIKKEVYPYYRLTNQDIIDLRITRWGHPLPLAATGLLNRGVVDLLRAPINDDIFFIEQDNWALPDIETVVAEASYWCRVIKQSLGG